MKKILIALTAFSLIVTMPAAKADGPPKADVSCSLIETGVRYGVSMTFTGSGISFSSLNYEWEYAIANPGANPQLVSSYGARTPFIRTSGNGLDLTYESMLGYARNDSNANIIIFANSIFSDGISTLTNKTGSGCYVDLPTVLRNRDQSAVSKAAGEKKAAEDAAKAAADAAKVAAETQLITQGTDRARVESAYQVLILKNGEIDSTISSTLSSYPTLKGNLQKFGNSRPRIPTMFTDDLTLDSVQSAISALTSFQTNLNTFIASQKKFLSTTIICVKGKTSKKVTAVNPKCPAGFKKK